MKNFFEKNYKIFVVLMLGFMFIVSVLNARNDSAIFDETAHIPAGYSYLKEHDMRLNPEHPPLLKDLAAFPLLFINPNFDTSRDFWTKDDANESQWNAGKVFFWDSGNNPDQIIFWSRIPIVLISLLLGFFIFRWTRELAGTLAGLFALALYAFNPNILGHNHFVTTDIGIAAFIVFAFYYFYHFIKKPTWKNVLIFGLFLGLMQLVKFSSVLTFPVIFLILAIYPLVKSNGQGKLQNLKEYILKGSASFLISIVIVWIFYYLNTFSMPQTKLVEIIDHYFHPYDPRLINVYARNFLFYINSYPILMPFADYLFGIFRVFQRVSGGNMTYFVGEVSSKSNILYFPLVFLIKESLIDLFLMSSALGLSIVSGIIILYRQSKNSIKIFLEMTKKYLRTNIASALMFSFVILYSYLSVTGNLNIGIRHLLPIFPFAFILTAKIIFDFIKSQEDSHTQRMFYFFVFVISAILAVQTILSYPSYMSYFNEAVGGSKNGYKIVTDSNADWGQDLKRLKLFLAEHPEIYKIRVDYFGGGNPEYYLGEKYISWWGSKRPIEKGWYAISATLFQESLYRKDKSEEESYRWLIGRKPDYQVGTSILIYNIK